MGIVLPLVEPSPAASESSSSVCGRRCVGLSAVMDQALLVGILLASWGFFPSLWRASSAWLVGIFLASVGLSLALSGLIDDLEWCLRWHLQSLRFWVLFCSIRVLRFALCGCLVCKLFGCAVVCGVEVLGEGSNDTP